VNQDFPNSIFTFTDELVANHGFKPLFDGTITLGDPSKSVFADSFLQFQSLFNVDVDPFTHNGTVEFNPHFRFERLTDQAIIAQHPQETRLSGVPR
jgi:hypothetical protein